MKILLSFVVFCLAIASGWGDQVATPLLHPDAGISATQFRVTVTCATANAIVHYTTNGIDPTISDPVLASGGNVLIGRNLSLKAKAWDGNSPAILDASETASVAYKVVGAVGAGAATSMALSFDEKLRVWGRNNDGRLGLGTTSNQLLPAVLDEEVISMDGSAEDSFGLGHTLWVKTDGTVWAAGSNSSGQLGNNSNTTPSDALPVQVQKQSGVSLINVLMVTAGKTSSYALTADGNVYAWGANGSAMRLGDGSTGDRSYADTVKTAANTPLTGIIEIASGDDHVLALKSDGTLWAWGANSAGQLGNNGTTAQGYAIPVQAGVFNSVDPSQPLTGVLAIAAGGVHSLAVTNGGAVYAWGEAALGRLGEGTTGSASSPTLRPVALLTNATTVFSEAVSVAAGAKFSLILKDDGTLWACGDNSSGQLGDGTALDRPYPVQVKRDASTFLTQIVDMAGGANHALALNESGQIFTWGEASAGQLGNGANTTASGSYATAYLGLPKLINSAPTLSLALQTVSSIQPGEFTLTATPVDADGNLLGVELFNNGVSVGSKTSAPWQWTVSGISAGNYEFTASAVDTVGALTTASPVSATVQLPTVTVSTSTPTLNEDSAVPGSFTVTRQAGAPTSASLIVAYTVSGSATAVSDYQALSGSVTIPAGQTSATVVVTPVAGASYEPDETIVVTLGAGPPSYSVGSPASATITLVDRPPVGSGLRLLLQANKGQVLDGNGKLSTWEDQSGLGNHAAQTTVNDRPTIVSNVVNGQPVIRFNGTNQYLILPNLMTGATAGEMYVVLKAASDAPSSYYGFMRFGTNTYGSNYPWTDKKIYDDFGTGVQNVVGDPGQPLDQYHLYNASSKSGEWSARINGERQLANATNTVSFPTNPWIGKQTYGYCFAGDVAELAVFGRALTASERVQVERSYGVKYQHLGSAVAAPSSLQATPLSSSQIALNWTVAQSLTSAQSYSVERKAGGGDYVVIGEVSDLSFIDTQVSSGTQYSYRVRAKNLKGEWSSFSNEVVASSVESGALLPVGSLRLWLRADAGFESLTGMWRDQSGRGNHASQTSSTNRPTLASNALNGRPVVRFNGSNQYFILPDLMSGATAGEMLLVLKAVQDAPTANYGFMRFGTSSYGSNYPWTDKKIYDDFGTNAQISIGDPPTSLDQFHLYDVSSKPAEWCARLNGFSQYLTLTNTVSFPTQPWLGKQNVYYFGGDIAEMMVFDRVLTTTERADLETYLNTRHLLVVPQTPTAAVKTVSSSQLNVAWPAVTGASSYVVERKQGANGTFAEIAVLDGARTGLVDNGLSAGTEYFYRVRVKTLGVFSSFSAAASASTALGALSLATNSLVVWLDAKAGVTKDANGLVSGILDWSGQGHNALQAIAANQPSWIALGVNQQPVLRFDGTADFLSLSGNLDQFPAGSLTAIVVCKPTNVGSWQRLFDFGAGSATNNVVLCRSGTSSALAYRTFSGGSQQTALDATNGLMQNSYQMLEVVHSGTTAKLFKNGSQLASGSASPIVGGSRTSNFVGKSNWGSDPLFQGDIAEILVFNTALSDSQRQEVEKYLNGKYNFGLTEADTDGDGLSDWTEFSFGSSPAVFDTDGDGLSDGQEFSLGSNPKSGDSDGDGMPDAWEVSHGLNLVVNDAQLDLDGDGFSNLSEWQSGTSPDDYYNGQHPMLTISGGDRQSPAPGQMVAAPLEVTVRNAQQQLLVNAPIIFRVTRSNGKLATIAVPAVFASEFTLRTNAEGKVAVLFKADSDPVQTGVVVASEVSANSTSSVTFAEAILGDDDSDADGMPDGWELLNALSPVMDDSGMDFDGDGLMNVDEYHIGSRANVADSDSDGMTDGWEVANGADPLIDDSTWDIGATGLTNLQWYQLSASRTGQWKLDEGNGSMASDSAGTNAGTLVNGPLWVADAESGSAVAFDGIDDYLTIANPGSTGLNFSTGSFTVVFQIKTQFSGAATIIGKGAQNGASGYRAFVDAGHVGFVLGASGVLSESLAISSQQAFNDDQWHHVVCTVDRSGKQARIDVDGISQNLSKTPGTIGNVVPAGLDFSMTGATLNGASSDALVFGAPEGSFQGALDHVELYAKALSLSESVALAGNLQNDAPLVAISQPLSGELRPAGLVHLRSNAFDTDGTIAKVQYYDGSVLLGQATQPPFDFGWTGTNLGSHVITAVATDNRGAIGSSAGILVTIVADSNANGMPDAWEYQYFGSLNEPANGDFDGDGVSNLLEYLLGRDPTVAASPATSGQVDLEVFTPLEQ